MRFGLNVALLTLLILVTPVTANEVFLSPQNARSDCNQVQVEIWGNVSEPVAGGQINLVYDPKVINLTDYQKGDKLQMVTWNGNMIAFITGLDNEVQQKFFIGTLTVTCLNCTSSVLGFDQNTSKLGNVDKDLEVTWEDGTVRCGYVESNSDPNDSHTDEGTKNGTTTGGGEVIATPTATPTLNPSPTPLPVSTTGEAGSDSVNKPSFNGTSPIETKVTDNPELEETPEPVQTNKTKDMDEVGVIPGFGLLFALGGLLSALYMLNRRILK